MKKLPGYILGYFFMSKIGIQLTVNVIGKLCHSLMATFYNFLVAHVIMVYLP